MVGDKVEQIKLLDQVEDVAASFESGLFEDGVYYSQEGVAFFANGGEIPVNRVTGSDLMIEEQRSIFHTALIEGQDPEITGYIY